MASVALEFALPPQPDLVKVYILESSTPTGPFNVIDIITEIGSYPDYIDNYTTNQALYETDWFAIMWEDAKGAQGDLSQAMQGNTQTVVGQVADRVQQRGVTATNEVVIQESEAVCERWFGVDPYTVPMPVSYGVLSGLTYLVMARLIVQSIVSGSSESYTAGLVSQKTGTGKTDQMEFVDDLLKLAAQMLGVPEIVVLQMADFDPTGLGTISTVSFDQTRQAITITYE
jgi:hypothetical protein